jgi:hypothetical protein
MWETTVITSLKTQDGLIKRLRMLINSNRFKLPALEKRVRRDDGFHQWYLVPIPFLYFFPHYRMGQIEVFEFL